MDFAIILTGSLVATNCAILGVYLVLRKNAMIGDAISHAVLPGIVLAFLATGSLNSLPMIIGAGLFGLLTTFIIETFQKKGKLQSDAAIGLTFTWLFAIGVILVSLFTKNTHIDANCVIHGEITLIPFDVTQTGTFLDWAPRSVWILSAMLVVNLVVIFIGYKGLLISSFDEAYAATVGVSVGLWHYVLMSLVSLTTVISFESVGAILVIAFLIVPAATAYLLVDKLHKMLLLSVMIGIVDVIAGYYLSKWLDSSIAGSITVAAGMVFALVFIAQVLNRKYRRKKDPVLAGT